MINRRTFAALLAGTVAAPKSAWSQSVTAKSVYYAGVGPDLTLYEIDIADAALQKRSTITLPANVQYAWPHPSKRYLYVVSSTGGPSSRETAGNKHVVNAFRIARTPPARMSVFVRVVMIVDRRHRARFAARTTRNMATAIAASNTDAIIMIMMTCCQVQRSLSGHRPDLDIGIKLN